MSASGSPSTEVFDSRLRFGAFLRPFVPTLAGVYVAIVLLVGLLLALFRLGALGLLAGLVVGAPVAVGLVVAKKRQFDETWGTTKLELSAAGATMAGRHVRVHLPWEHVRHLGAAHVVLPGRSTISGGGRAGALANLLSWALGRAARGARHPALIGPATTRTAPSVPQAIRGQLRQNDTCREVDPVTGRRMTAIVLTVYDPGWRDGRIGAWIRAYRPDLLTDAAAPTAYPATRPATPRPPVPGRPAGPAPDRRPSPDR